MIPIAVVGIDCRFPGAPDKDAFWRLMMDGVVTDTEVPSQRWDVDNFYRRDGAPGSMNTRRGHFIDRADAFDNDFFGIAPIEAAALDPQQRLLLQSSWRALEDAGIDPRSLAGTPTGVFVGNIIANGEAEIGFQQVSELSHFAGVDYVGPLPAEIQQFTIFSSGIIAGTKEADAAKALVNFITAPAAAAAFKRIGMEPG